MTTKMDEKCGVKVEMTVEVTIAKARIQIKKYQQKYTSSKTGKDNWPDVLTLEIKFGIKSLSFKTKNGSKMAS